IGRRRCWSAAWLYGVLAGLGAAGLALAFRQCLVPPLLNPLPPIDLAEGRPWLADWRLAAIKRHASVCARTLKAPQIEALQIADGPVHDGCGWPRRPSASASPRFAASGATPAATSGAARSGATAGASTPPPTPSISPASPWPTAAP